jgi:hypothetical protein
MDETAKVMENKKYQPVIVRESWQPEGRTMGIEELFLFFACLANSALLISGRIRTSISPSPIKTIQL